MVRRLGEKDHLLKPSLQDDEIFAESLIRLIDSLSLGVRTKEMIYKVL